MLDSRSGIRCAPRIPPCRGGAAWRLWRGQQLRRRAFSARRQQAASPVRLLLARLCFLACGSSNDRKKAAQAERRWPAPDLPGSGTVADREVDDLGTADNVLERDIANLIQDPAVGGIVAIVSHHEIVAGRNLVDRSVIERPILHEIGGLVARAARQRLAPAANPDRASRHVVGIDEILDTLARDRLAIEMEAAADHLDAVAGQADDAFDQID